MALAQGSGELIWWPYIIAKYGLSFLLLLLPACLLQFPVTYEIGRYTLLTGESISQGFIRLNRHFALFLWILMTLSFLWFGAFASAGGTSLAALTNFPMGWTPRGQTLFWGYSSMLVFLSAILLSKVIYRLVETFMWGFALVTLVGLLWASSQCRSAARSAVIRQGALHTRVDDAAPLGPGRRHKTSYRHYLRGFGWILDSFLLLLGARQMIGHGVLHGKVDGPYHRKGGGHSGIRLYPQRQ